ncbi:MAG: hypothetical protein EA428_08690 [Spirochaetaceae bacterium]|nr:MAG: hypothetical protein EA428_08690 [Spirochaetaceae bacterium]
MHGRGRKATAHGTTDPWSRVNAYRQQLEAGHSYCSSSGDDSRQWADSRQWTAKPGSHDDGPLCGLFLGGIGAPVVGRNLDGSFARWHLQNGYHLNQNIEQAFFALRWAPAGGAVAGGEAGAAGRGRGREPGGGTAPKGGGYMRLTDQAEPQFTREVLSLFPVIHEHYHSKALPLRINGSDRGGENNEAIYSTGEQ